MNIDAALSRGRAINIDTRQVSEYLHQVCKVMLNAANAITGRGVYMTNMQMDWRKNDWVIAR